MAKAKTTNTNEIKNKIVLFVGCYGSKKREELYDFSKLDHICVNGISQIRILCGSRFYYFKTSETTIAEIENY